MEARPAGGVGAVRSRLVGTGAEKILAALTVMAKQLKSVFGEALFPKPENQSAAVDPSAVRCAIVADMVNRKEDRFNLSATSAFAAVGCQYVLTTALPRRFRVFGPIWFLAFQHAGRTTRVVTPGALFGIQPETIQDLDFAAKTASPYRPLDLRANNFHDVQCFP